VSYLALRPLPSTDLGRDAEVVLEPGVAQEPAHHGNTRIQPALLIHAYLRKGDAAMDAGASNALAAARGGFVVELGDEAEYGSFAAFQAHARQATLAATDAGVEYVTGSDTLFASWDAFTVNGTDPAAYMKAQHLWQDTTLTQMGQARLEKGGAVIEREASWANLFLQTFPKQNRYVAMNLLPNYLVYRFREPGGVSIRADGALSMGRWSVKDSSEIDIVYTPFGGQYLPKDGAPAPATLLFISGTRGKPQVVRNGADVTAELKSWTHAGADGWLVSLVGGFPTDGEIAGRFAD
jgi:hypothetical protein